MAVLGAGDQAAVYAAFVAELNAAKTETITCVRADLKAAVQAVDAWIDGNAASFNSAIPQPARGALTAKQKARLLRFVVQRRFEVA